MNNIMPSHGKSLYVGCLCLLLQSGLFALQPNSTGRGPVFRAEFLTFRGGSDGKTLIEFWCEIRKTNLHFVSSGSSMTAVYEASVAILDLNQEVVAQASQIDSLKIKSYVRDGGLRPGLARISFQLEPGDYNARIEVRDLRSASSSVYTKRIFVPNYRHSLKLSDLHLSSLIERAQTDFGCVKNGWRIMPNPSRQFREHDRSIYVYSEVYNLEFGTSPIEKGVLSTFSIENLANRQVISLEIPNIKVGHESTLVAQIPIHELSYGRYKLHLKVEDLESGQDVEKSAYFFVNRDELVTDNR